MNKLRLRYSKTGKAKYISHLDLMATMRRALLRAGVELKYSEGFNPHPYLSVALPLPVGCSSVCELMDIGIADEMRTDGLTEAVTAALPEGIEVLDVYKSGRRFNEIAWIEICGSLYYEYGTPSEIVDRLSARFAEKNIVITKKTKKSISDIDIAPFLKGITFENDDVVKITARISAQNPSITTDNLISTLEGDHISLLPDFAVFTRLQLFDTEMKTFI